MRSDAVERAAARAQEIIIHQTATDPRTLDHSEDGADEPSAHPLEAGAPVRADSPTFAELGVRDEVVAPLARAGIERTFAIQELTLPLALGGADVIGQARTGTGKTLGFGVPLLQRITSDDRPLDGTPRALVVVPTRELCVQVTKDIADAGADLGLRVLSVYGGRPYPPQISALTEGVDVVVGTPGRLLDLAEQRYLVLGKVSVLVLDEADEMLDLGFLPDVERILRMVPEQRQTMLFSATMPDPILRLARTFLTQPTHIRGERPDATAVHEGTRQLVYRAHALDKAELLARALQARGRGLTLIFTRTKRTAQKVADDLTARGFAAAAVHGDLGQGAREQAMRAFRAEKVDVLAATDVAARGLDIPEVSHVINYQCPEDDKTYLHRIGRTSRAGREGVALTLVDWDDVGRWQAISDALDLGMPEPVETYSTSEHLYSDLDIPGDAAGRLPLASRTKQGLDAEPSEAETGRTRQRRPSRGSGRRDAERTETGGTRRRRRTRGGQPAAEGGGADTAATGGTDTAAKGGTDTAAKGGTDTAVAEPPPDSSGSDSGQEHTGTRSGASSRRRRRGGQRRRGRNGTSGPAAGSDPSAAGG